MLLHERIERQGNWIFRYRSYLPILMLLLILVEMQDYSYLSNVHRLNLIWELFSFSIASLGLAIRIYTIGYVPRGTSGRNTKKQIADVLNTTGIYSIVRNPLYLGNFFIWFAASLFVRELWLSLLVVTIFYAYHERVVFAEEQFLCRKFGNSYIEWANITPAFVPNFKLWKPTHMKFVIATVLKREYHGFFGIIATFALLEAAGNYFAVGNFHLDAVWQVFLAAGFGIYCILSLLSRYTNLLYVEGR